MDTNKRVTEELKRNLKDASPECRERIYKAWEQEVFPYNEDVKRYLQGIYDSCK